MNKGYWGGIYSSRRTFHWNVYLSALRSNEVIHGITSIISPQQAAFFAELVFCIDFTVTTASISSIPLSLPYRAKNRQFSPLKRTKTDDTQPKLSATCFVIQSCQTDAINSNFDELLSYEHPSKVRWFFCWSITGKHMLKTCCCNFSPVTLYLFLCIYIYLFLCRGTCKWKRREL